MRTHRIALVALALAAVLAVAFSVGVVMADARSALSNEIQKSERLAVSERASALGDSLAVASERIRVTANYPIVQLAVENRQTAMLQGALDTAETSPGVSGSAIIDRSGAVLAKEGHPVDPEPRAGYVFRSSDDFSQAFVTISAPVPGSDGQTAGWIIQEFALRQMVRQFTQAVPYMAGITSLVTRDGRVVMTTYANSSGQVTVPEVLDLIKQGRTGSTSFHAPKLGTDRLLAASPVPGTNLVALVGADRATASKPATALVWKLLGVLAVTMFVCAVLAGLAVLVLDRTRRQLVRERLAAELLANTDSLTSLENRRGFDAAVSVRRVIPGMTSVLLADLDYLKVINDTIGHDAGDDALRHAGAAIRSVIRPGDLAARVGGDEFAILLPDATEEQAREIATRVRVAVGAVELEDLGPLSISTGVATGTNAEILHTMTQADASLYEAKRSGRTPSRD